jgi:universal stress protein A
MPTTLFRRILVPHDFSAAADRALREAVALAHAHRGRIVLHHVVTPFYLPADPRFGMAIDQIPDPAALVPELTRRLEAIVTKAVGRTRVRWTVRVDIGDPATRLLEAAHRVDCVMMSTHGRTGLGHLLLGSVAEKLVRHAPVPVLTLRVPRTQARAARARRRAA